MSQGIPCDTQAINIAGVHDEYDGVGVGVVAAPVRTDGRLATQVPDLIVYVVWRMVYVVYGVWVCIWHAAD
ncbi:hypothetical protein EON63_08810 [archaeon]|nr:MAG: hypothetical protein EON63_08810 [archaeon]